MHVVATAGHVDHGKSTLVRALTGMEPDRFAEEKRRGMTIDLGFAWTTLPSGPIVAFVDVPGHERFVTTMLAGVGPVPAVLLVVSADEGWMPQSAEHVDALVALGVDRGLLVVTRSDLMEPELARDEAREHLADTPLAGMPAVCVSARTGAGMDELRTALGELVGGMPEPDPAADVRFWVDRAFSVRGAGTVVTGTLGAGRIRADDELELLTADGTRRVGVRGLQTLGAPVGEVRGVSRVALNLRGLPLEAVARGDVLLTPGAWLGTDVVDVRLHGVRAGGTPAVASLPSELSLHVGSVAVPARLRPLGADTVRLRLRRPVPLRIGDRAVLRDPGRRRVTAGLTVLDVRPPPLRRRGSAARRAVELAGMTGRSSAAEELARRGLARGADLRAMGVSIAGLDVPAAAGWLLDPDRASRAAAALVTAVAAHDAADPLDPGLSTEAARRAADLPESKLLDAVLRHAQKSHAQKSHAQKSHAQKSHAEKGHAEKGHADPTGLVLRNGRVVRSAAAGLPARVREALDALRHDLERAPFAAPEADRLAELGLGPRELATLVRAGELLRVADGVVLLPTADARAVEVLAGLDEEFTLSAARQALGTSRRVAVPLLELLARTGRTRRTPDGGHRLV
ncbi:selenocysteine-specific translation elongation factor [Pseudonocardia sp. 73-21]|uniref:selenocysteine-specific translation elongation factor n=1 Tax=Pseudonocardia sp. 73-21 TaxID=1895809 RepID=UPI0009695AD0|nr:selenocysteine-specific translation elongation factor [Pseudonocardia sp. 73-21]OJY48170.1 MAG: selenocysteine-specific translation elongation factor [Pseudonocardia sp. 73-21]